MKSFWQYVEAREVPTADINQQVFQTFQHLLPGHWGIYREDKKMQYLQTGGIVLLGNSVMEQGDQYLVGVRWHLFDDNARMAMEPGAGPSTYDPVRGSARLQLYYGVQGHKPSDSREVGGTGALGGMIKVNGLSMTPIAGDSGGFNAEADTPYDAARKVREMIEQYSLGHYRHIPGGVALAQDYYHTKTAHDRGFDGAL